MFTAIATYIKGRAVPYIWRKLVLRVQAVFVSLVGELRQGARASTWDVMALHRIDLGIDIHSKHPMKGRGDFFIRALREAKD